MVLELSKEPQDENEVVERYIILFLGVKEDPIPSLLHLEKEMFIFSNFNPNVRQFVHFEKHYYGPYSQEINELSEAPLHFPDAWMIENGKIKLTEQGKLIFGELLKHHEHDQNFQKMLEAIRLIRRLYDRLSKDELVLLVYSTYPEFREKSKIFERIYNKSNRRRLASSLLKKGVITQERYEEIIR